MKITGIGGVDYKNIYTEKKQDIDKQQKVASTDRLEISNVGKSLSGYSTEKNYGVSEAKLQAIRSEVAAGTYNKDSKLVAQKFLDHMKGREL